MGKYYFVSDAHLGSQTLKDEKAHEEKLVAWLDFVSQDASAIFLVGDIFDFWFEYRYTVPKGFTLLLGKLRQLTSQGIEIHFFTGNHDMWTFGYLENEVGLIVHKKPLTLKLDNHTFYIAHGDGLGDNSLGFKLLKSIFHSRLCQWLFGTLCPPRIGLGFGNWWSAHNRIKHDQIALPYRGEDKEHLVSYSKEYALKDPSIDHFVYGHRHIKLDTTILDSKQVVILGDFMNLFSYGCFDGKTLSLHDF